MQIGIKVQDVVAQKEKAVEEFREDVCYECKYDWHAQEACIDAWDLAAECFKNWKASPNYAYKLISAIFADDYDKEYSFKKRTRQVRDALNKCKDVHVIEQIATLLKV